jgi:hypothetical protein
MLHLRFDLVDAGCPGIDLHASLIASDKGRMLSEYTRLSLSNHYCWPDHKDVLLLSEVEKLGYSPVNILTEVLRGNT